jgi:1,4-dihydroxy-2-naphthoate octaprenyltransferase
VASLSADPPHPGLALWVHAARPRTLPAALVPVALGTTLAARDGGLHTGAALAALVTALSLQIGANFANDVFDFEHGADRTTRLGPPRATQSGLVSPGEMRRVTLAVFALASCSGLYLVWRGGWPVALAGALALLAGYAYTGGPRPLGYRGFGDILVFLFFGLVGVAGSAYVQTLEPSLAAVVVSLPIGFLATAILVVNNLRDIDGDREAGKITLAVRMGRRATRIYYVALLVGAHAVVALASLGGWIPLRCLLALASLPATAALALAVARREGPDLNPCLGATVLHEAAFGGLLLLGLLP